MIKDWLYRGYYLKYNNKIFKGNDIFEAWSVYEHHKPISRRYIFLIYFMETKVTTIQHFLILPKNQAILAKDYIKTWTIYNNKKHGTFYTQQ